MDLKTIPKDDGRVLTGNKAIVDATFLYDRVSRVPLVLHNTRMLTPGGIDDRVSTDLQLTKDSAANAQTAAALRQLGMVLKESAV